MRASVATITEIAIKLQKKIIPENLFENQISKKLQLNVLFFSLSEDENIYIDIFQYIFLKYNFCFATCHVRLQTLLQGFTNPLFLKLKSFIKINMRHFFTMSV